MVLDVTQPGEDKLYHINGWAEGELPLAAWAYLAERDGVRFWAAFFDKPPFNPKNPQSDLTPDMVILVEQLGSQLQLTVVALKDMARFLDGDPDGLAFDGSDTITLTRRDSGTVGQ